MQFNTSFHLTGESSTGAFLNDDSRAYAPNQSYRQNANNFYNMTFNSNAFPNQTHESSGQNPSYQWTNKGPQSQVEFEDEFVSTSARSKGDNLNYFSLIQPNNYSSNYTEDIALSHFRNRETAPHFNYAAEEKYIPASNLEGPTTTFLQTQKFQPLKPDSHSSQEHTSPTESQSFEKQLLNTASSYSQYPLRRVASIIENLDKEIEKAIQSGKSKELKNLQLEKKKHQHLFALVLLFQTFRISPDSVCPRNMVYLKYAEACKANRLQPICNAAFGKLVKLFNPKIKTRRLGMRGCSKYNYCGIEPISQENTLLKCSPEVKTVSTSVGIVGPEKASFIDLPNFYFFLTSDELSPPLITDALGNADAQILGKFYDFGKQAIEDLNLWHLESFVHKMKTFNLQRLLGMDLYERLNSKFDNHTILPKLTAIYIYLCMNVLEIIYNKVLLNPFPSILENLDYLERSFAYYFENLDLKEQVLRDQYEIGQKFLDTLSKIRKTFMLFYLFFKCFKDELDLNFFLEHYTFIDYEELVNKSGFDEGTKIEYLNFLKNIRFCVSCICFNSDDQTSSEFDSMGKASTHLSLCIQRLVDTLRFKAPTELIFQMNTTGILILQDISIRFPPEQHQKWLYLIGWINSFFTLAGQLGSFKIHRKY